MVNGISYHYGLGALADQFGAIYRGFVLLLLILLTKDHLQIVLSLLFVFLSLAIVHNLIYPERELVETSFVFHFQKNIKILLPIFLYFFVKEQLYYGLLNEGHIQKFLLVSSIILLGNLVLFYFGFGVSSYGYSTGADGSEVMMGGRGYFRSKNEIGGTFLIIYALTLLLFSKRSTKYFILISVIFLIGSIPLFTKTSLFGTLIISMLYFLFVVQSKHKLIVSLAMICLLSIPFFVLYSKVSLMFDRWGYFINEYGLITYITGGIKRQTFIAEYISNIIHSPINIFIGYGWKGYSENNLVDLIEAYGMIGIFILSLWYLWPLNQLIQFVKNKDREVLFASLCMMLIIIIAFFAGHIMQSAILAPFLAIIANYQNIDNKVY